MQQTDVRSGYLVLADISGYTAFLAGTELEHANGILSELTAHIRAALAPPLRFVKLEGDCVFCYAPEDAAGSTEVPPPAVRARRARPRGSTTRAKSAA